MNWTGGQLSSQKLHSNKYYLQPRIRRLKLMRLEMAVSHSQITTYLHDQKDKNKKETCNNKSIKTVDGGGADRQLPKKKPKVHHHSNKKKGLVVEQGFDLNMNVQNYKAIRELAKS